jgi:hypothetical protein
VERRATGRRWVEVDRQAAVCSLRRAHVERELSEGVYDSSVARFDVTRILESTNEQRSVREQCRCLVALRDDEMTER